LLSIVVLKQETNPAQIYDDVGARDQNWSIVAAGNEVTVNALTQQAG